MQATRTALAGLLIAVAALSQSVFGEDVKSLLAKLHAVGPRGSGGAEASAAWRDLAKGPVSTLPVLLASLDAAGPLAANWIRSAVDTIAERELQGGGKLPLDALEAFTLDTKHNPRGRRLAYEWLTRGDATAPDRLIPRMLHDPGVEFRRDAVARLIDEAADSKDDDARLAVYQKAFGAARDLDQIKLLKEKLKKAGVEVDLPTHFGFLIHWHLVGPFDNSDQRGFSVAYPPEVDLTLTDEYVGKIDSKPIKWFEHVTKDEYGLVDLNKALDKHKGAIAYATTYFESDRQQPVQFRLGSINATRLWLNGKLIDSHEVYHSGSSLDQYISTGVLKKGRNVILLKISQNEQTQSWAQRWEFQLRVCDPTGTAILATDREKRVAAKAP